MFRDLQLDDRELFRSYFLKKQYPHSQYNFTNLYMWKHMMQTKYAVIGDFLCITGTARDGRPMAMYPVGTGDIAEPVEALLSHFGSGLLFVILDDAMVEELTSILDQPYEVLDRRDSYDYVYKSETLITLSGKKLHAKRNHINKFKSLYSYEYRSITEKLLPQCAALEKLWIERKEDLSERERQFEYEATMRVIDHFEELGCRGGILFVDGNPAAFSIGEMMTEDTALIHIEKANTDYEGSFTFINQQVCEHEFSQAAFINREEDMGLEPLRKAKLSYRPERLNVAKHVVIK